MRINFEAKDVMVNKSSKWMTQKVDLVESCCRSSLQIPFFLLFSCFLFILFYPLFNRYFLCELNNFKSEMGIKKDNIIEHRLRFLCMYFVLVYIVANIFEKRKKEHTTEYKK